MFKRIAQAAAVVLPFLSQAPVAIADPISNLIGGRIVDPADYPASVKAVGSDGSSCTSTIIGERVLLTASHCVNHGASVRFSVLDRNYSANCSQSDDWRSSGGNDHDIALCLIDKPVDGITFENINIDSNLVAKDSSLLLSGYGCRTTGGKDTPDGNYRVGETDVVSIPSASNPYSYATSGGGALCFGDSGGPAFKILADTTRIVVAVNSAGDIATDSYITSTSSQESQDFFSAWVSTYGARICGLHADAKKCSGSQQLPDGSGDKCSSSSLSLLLANWSDCLLQAQPDLLSCDSANDKLQDCYATK